MSDELFPTDNPLDIPLLDVSLQALALDPPLLPWGARRRSKRMPGTWHFYVDDYRFDRLEQRPDLVFATEALGVIEPNFSVFAQTPLAVAIWQTYRKRWLARYWQTQGVRVWVDVNVSFEHAELNLTGVPAGWRAFATRGYETHPESVRAEHDLVAARFPGAYLLVYGGGKKVRAIAEKLGALHVSDDRTEVNDRMKRRLVAA